MKKIKLTQGKFTLVDDEDYKYLSQWKWYAHKQRQTFYAVRGEYLGMYKSRLIKMHRVILGLSDPKVQCDHIDRNGLNNQRSNLRVANASQNGANKASKPGSSSKFIGVTYRKDTKKWQVRVKKNKVVSHFGCYKTEEEAALVYNINATILHGEFARLNIVNY